MKKQLLTLAAAASISSTVNAAIIKVDFDFGVSAASSIADFTIQDIAANIGGDAITFDLIMDGTLDNGSDGIRVSPNGGQAVLFRGDGSGSNTGSLIFSIADVQSTQGKTYNLQGIRGGLFSNFNTTNKSFIADRTYTGGLANDGTNIDTEFQLDFDSVASSSTITASGTTNFRMHDIDLDLVAAPESVPEPSSAALLALGGLTLTFRRRN